MSIREKKLKSAKFPGVDLPIIKKYEGQEVRGHLLTGGPFSTGKYRLAHSWTRHRLLYVLLPATVEMDYESDGPLCPAKLLLGSVPSGEIPPGDVSHHRPQCGAQQWSQFC